MGIPLKDPYDLGHTGPLLIELAADTVRKAAHKADEPFIEPASYPIPLRKSGAAFVTLEKRNKLRGCIGSLESHDPLVVNVAHNAYSAACRDTRFPSVIAEELNDLMVSVSVLSPLESLTFTDESDLLTQITPRRDGVFISGGGRRATFLPQVWEELPEPETFISALKKKGGWAQDEWPKDAKAWRYHVTSLPPILVGAA